MAYTKEVLAVSNDHAIYLVYHGLCRTGAISSGGVYQSRGVVYRGPNRVLPMATYGPGSHDETNYVCAVSRGSWSENGPCVVADYPSSRGTYLGGSGHQGWAICVWEDSGRPQGCRYLMGRDCG